MAARFLLLLALLNALQIVKPIEWLAMVGMSSTSQLGAHNCASLRGLNKRQIRLCKRNVEHMDSVRIGAHMAVLECQYQFKYRRWNCTVVDPVNLFGTIMKLGTRESAFVHAISAAGVSHKVTRDCSSGHLHKCGCDSSFRGDSGLGFQWAGCSDNVHYGNAFSRAFVDAHERKKRQPVERMLMNLHNNEAGRKMIERNMELQCKCHGVSGSCELKTCWRAMPNFRRIGDILKSKFDGATEVKSSRKGTRKTLVPVFPYLKKQTPEDLVYLDQSPDYCDADPKLGTLGTQGRICNSSAQGINGCELLCCHRGFQTRVELVTERCRCKFHWCCYVKCKECSRHVEINTCN